LPLGQGRARLSARALRLYDRLGLLTPARVDEAGGNRRYRAGQVERARPVAAGQRTLAGSSGRPTGRLRAREHCAQAAAGSMWLVAQFPAPLQVC
jgi:hypothetical protein